MIRAFLNALLLVLGVLVLLLLAFAFMVSPAHATTAADVCAVVGPSHQNEYCGSSSTDCIGFGLASHNGQTAYCGFTVGYQENGFFGPGYYQSMNSTVTCPTGEVTTVSVPYYRASGGTADGGPVTMVPDSIKTLPSSGCYSGCSVDYGSYHLAQNPPVYWRIPYDPAAGPVDVYLHVDATTTGAACSPDAGGQVSYDDQPASNLNCLIDSATGQCATCALDPATGTCAATQPGGGTTGGGTTGGGTTGGGTTGGGTTGGTSGTGTTGGTAAGPGTPASGSGSGFGGTCAAGFSCSGDAVQCAQAQAAWELQCVFKVNPADPAASAAEAAYAASSPGPAASSVNFSLSSWTDRVIGPNGGCPADVVVGHGVLSATLPFSQYCGVLQNIGLAGNAISMLIAVGIVFGRKASEAV